MNSETPSVIDHLLGKMTLNALRFAWPQSEVARAAILRTFKWEEFDSLEWLIEDTPKFFDVSVDTYESADAHLNEQIAILRALNDGLHELADKHGQRSTQIVRLFFGNYKNKPFSYKDEKGDRELNFRQQVIPAAFNALLGIYSEVMEERKELQPKLQAVDQHINARLRLVQELQDNPELLEIAGHLLRLLYHKNNLDDYKIIRRIFRNYPKKSGPENPFVDSFSMHLEVESSAVSKVLNILRDPKYNLVTFREAKTKQEYDEPSYLYGYDLNPELRLSWPDPIGDSSAEQMLEKRTLGDAKPVGGMTIEHYGQEGMEALAADKSEYVRKVVRGEKVANYITVLKGLSAGGKTSYAEAYLKELVRVLTELNGGKPLAQEPRIYEPFANLGRDTGEDLKTPFQRSQAAQRKLKEVLNILRSNASDPFAWTIINLDEIDQLVAGTGDAKTLKDEWVRILDSLKYENPNVLIIATTNDPDKLEPYFQSRCRVQEVHWLPVWRRAELLKEELKIQTPPSSVEARILHEQLMSLAWLSSELDPRSYDRILASMPTEVTKVWTDESYIRIANAIAREHATVHNDQPISVHKETRYRRRDMFMVANTKKASVPGRTKAFFQVLGRMITGSKPPTINGLNKLIKQIAEKPKNTLVWVNVETGMDYEASCLPHMIVQEATKDDVPVLSGVRALEISMTAGGTIDVAALSKVLAKNVRDRVITRIDDLTALYETTPGLGDPVFHLLENHPLPILLFNHDKHKEPPELKGLLRFNLTLKPLTPEGFERGTLKRNRLREAEAKEKQETKRSPGPFTAVARGLSVRATQQRYRKTIDDLIAGMRMPNPWDTWRPTMYRAATYLDREDKRGWGILHAPISDVIRGYRYPEMVTMGAVDRELREKPDMRKKMIEKKYRKFLEAVGKTARKQTERPLKVLSF